MHKRPALHTEPENTKPLRGAGALDANVRHSHDWNLALEAAAKICLDRKAEYIKQVRLHWQGNDYNNRLQECAGEAENIAQAILKLRNA